MKMSFGAKLGILFGMTLFICSMIGFLIVTAIQAQEITKEYDIQLLAWEIKQETGLNLGGYYETDGTPQTGSITVTNDVIKIFLEPDVEGFRSQIDKVVSNHDSSKPLPSNFPIKPTAIPVSNKTLQEKYQLAITTDDKIKVIAEALGLE